MHRDSSLLMATGSRRESPRKVSSPALAAAPPESRRPDFELQRAAAEDWHRERSDRSHRKDCLLGSTKGLAPRDRTATLLMCLGEARRYQATQMAKSRNASAISSPTSRFDTYARPASPHSPTGRREWFDVTPQRIYLEVRKDIFLLMQQAPQEDGPHSPASPKRQAPAPGEAISTKDPYGHTMQELARLRMWNYSA